MVKLNRDAETFLAKLAECLRPLGHDQRAGVVLELRSHLEDCQRQGLSQLASALAEMGPAETLARDFIEASSVALCQSAKADSGILLPAVIANSSLPLSYMRGVPRLNFREVVHDLRATLAATRDELWSVCAFMVAGFTATSLFETLRQSMPNEISAPLWLIYGFGMTIGIVGCAAAYRCMLGRDEPVWQFDLSLLRFVLASAVLLVITVGAPNLVYSSAFEPGLIQDATQPAYYHPAPVAIWIVSVLVLLRLQPWVVSFVLDRPISSRLSWAGTAGKSRALTAAWLLAAAPGLLMHIILNRVAFEVSQSAMADFGFILAFVDGIAVMTMLIGTALVNAMAFRWIAREPIPAPRPFSSTRPTDAQIADTNLRFHRFVAEKKRRDLETALGADLPANW